MREYCQLLIALLSMSLVFRRVERVTGEVAFSSTMDY